MKKSIYYISKITIIIILSYALYACDKEDNHIINDKIENKKEKDKTENTKPEQNNEGSQNGSTEDTKPEQNNGGNQNGSTENTEPKDSNEVVLSDMRSNLVIMDFTGQRCAACGNLLKNNVPTIMNSQDVSDKVILVAIHGWSGFSKEFYNIHSGQYINSRRVGGIPYVAFNNTPGNKGMFLYGVREKVNSKRVLKTEVEAKLTHEGERIDVSVIAKKVKDGGELKAKKLNVLIWILENDLVAYQLNIGHNYNHQHILRGYLGGNLWGEEYKLGETYKRSGNMLNTVSNKGNCEVVAIILDAETKEFIDAEKVKLK